MFHFYRIQEESLHKEDISFNESIKFNNVSFGYNKNLILENINFKIKKGDIVGLVGSSGSGKTTFINLCLGLIKPLEGKIIIEPKFDNCEIISDDRFLIYEENSVILANNNAENINKKIIYHS